MAKLFGTNFDVHDQERSPQQTNKELNFPVRSEYKKSSVGFLARQEA